MYNNMRNIVILLWFASLCSGHTRKPCNFHDDVCTTKAAKNSYVDFVTGVPTGYKSDPLTVEKVEVNLPEINYKLHNIVLKGLINCTPIRVKSHAKMLHYIYEIKCPQLITEAEYEVSGKINDVFMEGKGTFKSTHDDYDIALTEDYVKVHHEHDKEHTYIKLTKLEIDLNVHGKVTYEYQNLFNGDKDKSDAFHQHFQKENWKSLDETFGAVTMEELMKKMVLKNVNKYFETVPIEDVFYLLE